MEDEVSACRFDHGPRSSTTARAMLLATESRSGPHTNATSNEYDCPGGIFGNGPHETITPQSCRAPRSRGPAHWPASSA